MDDICCHAVKIYTIKYQYVLWNKGSLVTVFMYVTNNKM